MVSLDFFSSLFWFLFSIYVSVESYRLGLGEMENPGPGFFPFSGSLLLGIMSLSVLIKTSRNASRDEVISSPSESLRWQNVVLILVAMALYTFLLNQVGFVLCTFLLIVFFLRVVAPQRWVKAVGTAFFITMGSHILFNVFLKAQLPKGFFIF